MTTHLPNEFHIPVSITELSGYDFSVTPDTLTEKIVAELENQPSLPGVMIIDKGQLLGIITRSKLFERLGHRYGVELFLQKPIVQLKDLIRTQAMALRGHYRIDEAIQCAISRPPQDVYDPIVVLHDDGSMTMLDFNVLLLAQSRAIASLSNVVGTLDLIDRMIYAGNDRHQTFIKMFQLLRQVVPYHQSAILLNDQAGMSFAAYTGYLMEPNRADAVLKSNLYSIMIKNRQAIFVPSAYKVPAWRGMESLGKPMAWLGVPLIFNDQPFGLLSISRNVERAFSSGERDTAQAFAQRIINLLKREQRNIDNVVDYIEEQENYHLPQSGKPGSSMLIQENMRSHGSLSVYGVS